MNPKQVQRRILPGHFLHGRVLLVRHLRQGRAGSAPQGKAPDQCQDSWCSRQESQEEPIPQSDFPRLQAGRGDPSQQRSPPPTSTPWHCWQGPAFHTCWHQNHSGAILRGEEKQPGSKPEQQSPPAQEGHPHHSAVLFQNTQVRFMVPLPVVNAGAEASCACATFKG